MPSEPIGNPIRPLVGNGAPPWAEWLEILSRDFRASTARSVYPLLMRMLEAPGALDAEQLRNLNAAARRLLEFAWAQDPVDAWLAVGGLVTVCRTFLGGPEASATLIRRSLAADHLIRHGVEEMPRLAYEVSRLFAPAPDLVEDIYRAAFAYEESSTAGTQMYASQILPLRSNRRQDYDIALFTLADVFPAYLKAAPLSAARALIASANPEQATGGAAPEAAGTAMEFSFRGQIASICPGEGLIASFGNSYVGDMLKAFGDHLGRPAGSELNGGTSRIEERREVLDLIASENCSGAVWRLLLQLGTKFPQDWGADVQELGEAVPILTNMVAGTAAGDYLAAVFGYCDPAARGRIERAILAIAGPSQIRGEGRRSASVRLSDRLLRRLPADALVTREARALRPTDQEPAASVEERWGAGDIADDGFLAGDDPLVASLLEQTGYRSVPSVSALGECARQAEAFAERYRNETPVIGEAAAVVPALRELRALLADVSLAPEQRDMHWGYLTQACAAIAGSDGLDYEEGTGAFVREVLLEASRNPEPRHQLAQAAWFDETLAWGAPAPRVDAAQGLLRLVRPGACGDEAVLEAIERLSQDEVAPVRMQVACFAARLYAVDEPRLWRILNRLCRYEPSRGVLQRVAEGALSSLRRVQPDRVGELLRSVYHRASEGASLPAVRCACLPGLISLYVERGERGCGDLLSQIAQHPLEQGKDAKHMAHVLRETGALICGPADSTDPEMERMRQRALDLFGGIVRSTRETGRHLRDSYGGTPAEDWPEDAKLAMRGILELADSLGKQVFFASGAFDAQRGRAAPDMPSLCRFLREMVPVVDDLAQLGFVRVAHDLVQTLVYLLPCDPQGVFRRVGRIVGASSAQGYQFEGMAAGLIVTLVERVLAEYRPMLRQDTENRRVLIDLLDTFVRAGWPEAQRLTCHLEEIFR